MAQETAGEPAEAEHLYFRWAGGIVRHPPGRPEDMEIFEGMEWKPGPAEAIRDVAAVDPEQRTPNAWCTRLSDREAKRMITAMSGKIV